MDRVECDRAHFQSILLANIKWHPGRSAFTSILSHKIESHPPNVDVYADAFLQLAQLIHQILHQAPDRKTELATVMDLSTSAISIWSAK